MCPKGLLPPRLHPFLALLIAEARINVRFGGWIQLIAATHSANLCAGDWYCKVLRGRSLSWRAIALNFAWEAERSVPLGRYCYRRPIELINSPRCQRSQISARCADE